jgi:hypothetical protein
MTENKIKQFQLKLKSEISKCSKVVLGAGNKETNKIVIKITNNSNDSVEFLGRGSKGEISLTIKVGDGPEDLVATPEESTKITIDTPEKWGAKKPNYGEGEATWSFRLPNKVFGDGEAKTIVIKSFESKTDPGEAKLTIAAKISGYTPYPYEDKTLKVTKEEAKFQLLYFKAEPPYLITEEDKEGFHLTWNTVKAKEIILYKNNIRFERFESGKDGFETGKKFIYKEDKPTFTTVYKLVAIDQDDKRKTEELTVQVLKPGWHKIAFPRRGYPTVFCNMNDAKLYGIFKKDGKASLYSSVYPLSVWDLANPDVPEGMETSPAVCFENKLWLVGGGAADPNTISKKVFCLEGGEWIDKSDKVPGEFTARMGHSCVVFKEKIWVLGGMDTTGKVLNQVWSFDSEGNWEQHKSVGWSERCMFAATVYDDMIWLYGGVEDPVGGRPLDDMWTSSDGENWDCYSGNPDKGEGPALLLGEGRPIACTLLVVKDKMHLLGAFWRDASVRARKFVLEDSQKRWRTSEIPEAVWLDQMEGNFKLLSVEYKGKVYLTWIDYSAKDAPRSLSLNMYVP